MRTIEYEWFIPHNVPSLKNSKQISRTKKGKTIVRKSNSVLSYLEKLGIEKYSPSRKEVINIESLEGKVNLFTEKLMVDEPDIDIYQWIAGDTANYVDDNWGYCSFYQIAQRVAYDNNVPLELGFHQVRDSKRKFDMNNSFELITDLLTAHKIIPDDNCDCLIPIPYKRNEQWYTVDKENAGCFLRILNKI